MLRAISNFKDLVVGFSNRMVLEKMPLDRRLG
jgi:hypothetical protein